MSTHHNVEAVAKCIPLLRSVPIKACYQTLARSALANRVEDRVILEQRIVWKEHLSDQALSEEATEDGEVYMRRSPRIGVIPPRIRSRLDREELKASIGASQDPARP